MLISFVFGTRPEAIKLAPVINFFLKHSDYKINICFTGQHKDMVMPILDFFKLKINKNLELMRPNCSLTEISGRMFIDLGKYIEDIKPDLIFVQGDTTTAMIGATVSFFMKIKIAHIEAGLRTFDIQSPFPEEFNRQVISKIADYHFVPTELSRQNLINENIDEHKIILSGNTSIDALIETLKLKQNNEFLENETWFNNGKKIILITCHRRENFGIGLENICRAITDLANKYPEINFVYPVHPNPNVQDVVNKRLSNFSNIHLIKPLDYFDFVTVMAKSFIILTDSGGIQEEAPTLGIPVLVMRTTTERPEAILAGTSKLVGIDYDTIFHNTVNLIENQTAYNKMAKTSNPFGDGNASEKIFTHISMNISKHKN